MWLQPDNTRKTVLLHVRPGDPPRETRDNILPFLSYRFGRAFDGLLENRTSTEEEWIAGATFTNVIGYLCQGAERSDDVCTGSPGTLYKVTLGYSDVDSSDEDSDRRGPKFSAEFQRPVFGSSSLWVEGSAEYRDYDTRVADDPSQRAEAGRYSLAAGVDVSPWAHRTFGFNSEVTARLGVRWVKVDATAEVLDRDEFAFVPTLAWER